MKHKKIFLISLSFQIIASSSFFNPNLLPKLAAIYNKNNVPNQPELPAGTLDLTFVQGVGYRVDPFIPGTTFNNLNDVAIDSKNRIIGVGQVTVDSYAKIALVRYLPNGNVDTSFGDQGYVVYTMAEGVDNYGTAVIIDDEDRIIIAGTVDNEFALARFLVDGSLDDNFNGGYPITVGGDNFASELLLDSFGNFIISGTNSADVSNFLVARYTPDGTLDGTFGNGNGYYLCNFPGINICYSAALDAENNIYLCGATYNDGEFLSVSKIYADGSNVDTSFGVDGLFVSSLDEMPSPVAYAIATDNQARLLVGGGSNNGYFLLLRLTQNGDLDTTFGDGYGYKQYNFDDIVFSPYTENPVKKVIIDPLLRIIMFGGQILTLGGTGFVIARVLQSGALDTTFGQGGVCYTNLGSVYNICMSGALDQQGKIVAVGLSDTSIDKFGVTRFTTDYSLDYYKEQFAQQPLGLF